MMTLVEISDIAGNIGALIGALAVIATLLYLALQVKAATRASEIAALEASRGERREFFTAVRDSPYMTDIIIKLRRDEPLNDVEIGRLTAHGALLWGLVFSEWAQKRTGIVFNHTGSAMLQFAISQEWAILWWNSNILSKESLPAAYVEEVDAAIEAAKATPVFGIFSAQFFTEMQDWSDARRQGQNSTSPVKTESPETDEPHDP